MYQPSPQQIQMMAVVRDLARQLFPWFEIENVRQWTSNAIREAMAVDEAYWNRWQSAGFEPSALDPSGNIRPCWKRQMENGDWEVHDTESHHKKGWPFSTNHGIEEPPGCVLAAAAINDYAAYNPDEYDVRYVHSPLGPMHPEPLWFHWLHWWHDSMIWNTDEVTLREVIAAAKQTLIQEGLIDPEYGTPRGTAQSPAPCDDPTKPPTVDLHLSQVRYAGRCFNVSGDGALLFDAIIKADGERISAGKVVSKPRRVYDSLPPELQDIVDPSEDTNKGYRLDLPK